MPTTDFQSLLNSDSFDEPFETRAVNGRELDELISPISAEEFVNSYFSKVSLSVEGTSNKFDQIFSWGKLKQALKRGQSITDKRYNLKASFTCGEDSGSPADMIDADHNQVIDLLNDGATICITNIQMADPVLAQWALAIRAQLNFSGGVGINCYISPDGSGLPMHYDSRVATTLQIAGKKRWKFSTEPAKVWPNTNEVYEHGQTGNEVGKLPDKLEFREVELKPGDMLCLPAGAWHSARGIGFSLALNLSFSPRNYLDQLMPLLQNFAASSPDWRGGVPVTAEKIQGTTPENVSTYMHDRLGEFQKLLEAVGNADALSEPWLSSLTHASYALGTTEDRPIPEITLDQQFVVAESPLSFVECQDRLIILFQNRIHKFPAGLTPILERISSAATAFILPEVLSLQEKTNSLSPNEIVHYMKVLYRIGIINRV